MIALDTTVSSGQEQDGFAEYFVFLVNMLVLMLPILQICWDIEAVQLRMKGLMARIGRMDKQRQKLQGPQDATGVERERTRELSSDLVLPELQASEDVEKLAGSREAPESDQGPNSELPDVPVGAVLAGDALHASVLSDAIGVEPEGRLLCLPVASCRLLPLLSSNNPSRHVNVEANLSLPPTLSSLKQIIEQSRRYRRYCSARARSLPFSLCHEYSRTSRIDLLIHATSTKPASGSAAALL